MKHKIIEWAKRYLPAEMVGIGTSLIIGIVLALFSHHVVALAYVATWADNLGYYGYMVTREARANSKKYRDHSEKFFLVFWKTLRNLVVEFGPAEILDSFILRPLIIFGSVQVLHSTASGILVGNILANITFYIPTIFSYELRKKFLKD